MADDFNIIEEDFTAMIKKVKKRLSLEILL